MTIKERVAPKLDEIYADLSCQDPERYELAWEKFYLLTHSLMLGWVLRIAGDEVEVEDIVQSAYLNISVRLKRTDLEPIRDLYAFCFGTLKKIIMTEYRKKLRRREKAQIIDFDTSAREERQIDQEMELFSERIDFLVDLAIILNTLTLNERELLTFLCLEMNAEEICKKMASKYSNTNVVHQAIFRVKKKARKEIERRGLTRTDFSGFSK